MKHAFDLYPLFAWETGLFPFPFDSPCRLESHCELAIAGPKREPPMRREQSMQRKPDLRMRWVWVVDEDERQ